MMQISDGKGRRIGALLVALGTVSLNLDAQAVSVWRKVDPPPTSRQEWVAPQTQAPGPGWIPDPRSRPGMTPAEARVAADLSRLGSDFSRACDRSYIVARDIGGRPTVLLANSGATVPGVASTSAPMCCEDAFNNAFPTASGANDCRGLDLFSAPGRIMLGPAGFVSTTGGTVTLPSAPPIAIPPAVFTATTSGTNDWHVWRRIDRPPSSRSDWYTVSKQQPPGFERAPEDKPNLTFAEASAIADAAILSPNFSRVCERSWWVWRNLRTGKLETASNPTAQTFGQDPWGESVNGLCCEEAFNRAFPGNFAASDCRRVNLRDGHSFVITPNGPLRVNPTPGPFTISMPNPFETQPGRPTVSRGPGQSTAGGPTITTPVVPPTITNPGAGGQPLPPGPAGSLPLVKSEINGKSYRDKWGSGCDYTATSIMCILRSDEAGPCDGRKDFARSEWTFSPAPGSLPLGGEVSFTVTGTVTACPESAYNFLDFSAGVSGRGLTAVISEDAKYYRRYSRLQGRYTFRVPPNTKSVQIEFWLYGLGHAGHYNYGTPVFTR